MEPIFPPPPWRVLFILPDAGLPPTKGYQVRCLEIASALGSRFTTRVIAARRSAALQGLGADARPLWRLKSLLQRLLDGGPLQSALFDGEDVARKATGVVRDWQPHAIVIVTERLPVTALALRDQVLVIDVVDSMRLHMSERATRSRQPVRTLWNREACAFRQLLPRVRGAAAAIVVASDTGRADYPDAFVIANAARASALPRPAPTIDVVFTGTLSYWPNVRAALEVCRHIAPRIRASLPKSRIAIAGQSPPRELRNACRDAGVDLLPNVQTMDDVLRHSRLALAPIDWSPGANLKILEALAAGTPVLAYSAAAARLPVDITGIRVCDGAADMAIQAVAILTGRSRVVVEDRSRHTWAARAREFEGILESVITRTAHARTFP
jgi:glycosyltransferase involved in cell wall biosynthesis